MKEPYGEGLAIHAGPESCVLHPRGCGRSVDRGTCGLGIEPRKNMHSRRRPCATMGKATRTDASRRVSAPALRGRRPQARMETPCAEPGRSCVWPHQGWGGPRGEGRGGRSP